MIAVDACVVRDAEVVAAADWLAAVWLPEERSMIAGTAMAAATAAIIKIPMMIIAMTRGNAVAAPPPAAPAAAPPALYTQHTDALSHTLTAPKTFIKRFYLEWAESVLRYTEQLLPQSLSM